MSDYFETTWSLNHGIDTNEVSPPLRPQLAKRAMIFHRRPLIRRRPN